jgi:hypothetical protein
MHAKQASLRMSSDFPDLFYGWVKVLSLYVYVRREITELHHTYGTCGLWSKSHHSVATVVVGVHVIKLLVVYFPPFSCSCTMNMDPEGPPPKRWLRHISTVSRLRSPQSWASCLVASDVVATNHRLTWLSRKMFSDEYNTGRKWICLRVQGHLIFQDRH